VAESRDDPVPPPPPEAAASDGAAKDPIVSVEDVHLAFDGKEVLRGASLEVRRGETVVILGESGGGKTVFLRVMLALQRPDRGSVRLFGVDVVGKTEEELEPVRRRVSVVYQMGALFSGLDVAGNIALELREVLHLPEDEIERRIQSSLQAVGLSEIDPKQMPDELSGGMKKRLAVARAIAPKPELVVYDEPVSGLDPINSARVLDLIRDLHDQLGVTSIVVTHDVLGACRIATRLLLLSGGVFVFDGTPERFLASREEDVAAFREAAQASAVTNSA
jgi:phospholipid/cholesterol/gamma-HCH transport system ATP-binding protein